MPHTSYIQPASHNLPLSQISKDSDTDQSAPRSCFQERMVKAEVEEEKEQRAKRE